MSKSTDKKISIMMRKLGYNPLELTTELRKKSVQRMTLKERCEHINQMKLPFGVVRCTPHRLLKKWLGIDLLSVIEVGIHFCSQSRSTNMYFNSCFHISHIEGDKVADFGFFTSKENMKLPASEECIDEILQEGVIDLSNFDGTYTPGFGPKTFEKIKISPSM